jgi:hypothetical protein
MKRQDDRPPLKFDPPSRELRDAVRMIKRARLANALAAARGVTRAPPLSPELKAALTLVADAKAKRMAKLYEYFWLQRDSPHAGDTLAYGLACRFVPGFDPYFVPAQGRPRSVRNDHGPLVHAVQEARKRNPKFSINAACAWVSKHDARYKGKSPTTLASRYHRFFSEEAKEREQMEEYRHSEK